MKRSGTKGSASKVNDTTEANGGVKFELVGLPACMDEENQFAQSGEQPQNQIGDVMVFDMGKKPAG